MQKLPLSFTEKVEPRFIHGCGAQRPRVAQIELLDAFIRKISESRQACSAGLEARERLRQVVLREIVVTGEVLIFCQLVIHLKGRLVGSLVPHGHSLKRSIRSIRQRHKLIQQVSAVGSKQAVGI